MANIITSTFQMRLMDIQGSLYSFALLLTANREDANDLLQETSLKALDNQDKYIDNTNFKGWIFKIMRNQFINNYRRAARSATIVDTSDDLYHLNISENNSMDSPEKTYAVAEITKTINEFDQKYREPFAMYIVGYRYNEIAERMGLPLGTVKSRIFSARRILQHRFADYR